MKDLLTRLWEQEEAQDLTEYVLLLIFLSLAAIGSLGTVANAINSAFGAAAKNI
jgi:Flp pilus assembly pilin Flp